MDQKKTQYEITLQPLMMLMPYLGQEFRSGWRDLHATHYGI